MHELGTELYPAGTLLPSSPIRPGACPLPTLCGAAPGAPPLPLCTCGPPTSVLPFCFRSAYGKQFSPDLGLPARVLGEVQQWSELNFSLLAM